MVKHPATHTGMCTLLLIAALIGAGCTSSSGGNVTPSPVPAGATTAVVAETPVLGNCGLTTCHGLDVACGMNAPEICTMEYRIGDKCRQYASCDTSGGSCTLVKDPRFDTCKTCVEQCQAAAQDNPVMAFSCEEKC